MGNVTVYQADAQGWYMGEALAQVSPREPGVVLMPAGASAAAPPPRHSWPDGCMPRLAGGQWVMQTVPAASDVTPMDMLRDFLAAHPEVLAELTNSGSGRQ